MAESARKLKLTESTPSPWDDRRFRWQLRDAGWLHKRNLTEAPLRVLMMHYCLADKAGEADLPQRWIAEQLGLTRAAVNRALQKLEKHGLVTPVGASTTAPSVYRYRLETLAADPQPAAPSGVIDGSPCDRQITGGVIRESRGCDPPITQSNPGKPSGESSSSASAASAPEPGDGERSLWDKQPCLPAAAAFLVACGVDPQQAKGLNSRYRPTVGQLRTIYVNAKAWQWAKRRGWRRDPLHNLPGFMVSGVKALSHHPPAEDGLVGDIRQRARRRAREVQQRRKAKREQAQQQAEADRQRRIRQQAEERFAHLSAQEHERYRQRFISTLEPSLEHWADYPIDHPRVRNGILELIAEELEQG